jgi:hypothetical protein
LAPNIQYAFEIADEAFSTARKTLRQLLDRNKEVTEQRRALFPHVNFALMDNGLRDDAWREHEPTVNDQQSLHAGQERWTEG